MSTGVRSYVASLGALLLLVVGVVVGLTSDGGGRLWMALPMAVGMAAVAGAVVAWLTGAVLGIRTALESSGKGRFWPLVASAAVLVGGCVAGVVVPDLLAW